MEDFRSAFAERHRDVLALDSVKRRTAAMHFGGVAIECLLKSIIAAYLPVNRQGQKEWKLETNDPGHTIRNPGHNYDTALRAYNKLGSRVANNPAVVKWLKEVETQGCHFIDMRYLGTEPEDEKYKKWKTAYTSLVGWLEKQATQM